MTNGGWAEKSKVIDRPANFVVGATQTKACGTDKDPLGRARLEQQPHTRCTYTLLKFEALNKPTRYLR